ncbi:HNH endonuclease [Variovorax sp. YR634]|uniref:HNH endonuclease n=1 Tax=Variovorax sp. YR634 TaxID=1884385 RepID=UPI0035263E78
MEGGLCFARFLPRVASLGHLRPTAPALRCAPPEGRAAGARSESKAIGDPTFTLESRVPSTLISSRTSAFIRQGGLCCYCDEPMWLADPATFAARYGLTRRQAEAHRCTAEHLHARCDGGRDDRENIAAACALCNHRRHARRAIAPDPDAYRRLVLARLRRGRWRPWRVAESAGVDRHPAHPAFRSARRMV